MANHVGEVAERLEAGSTSEAADLVAAEWDLLRGELQRLLNEGHKNRYALVKQGHPITVWDSLRDAAQAGRVLFGSEPCLVQQILPDLRPLRIGHPSPCRA